MNWSEERYVRVYIRDTPEWLSMRWQTRAILLLVLRVLDSEGYLDLGGMGAKGVALMLAAPEDVVAVAVEELVARGTYVLTDDWLFMPSFAASQKPNGKRAGPAPPGRPKISKRLRDAVIRRDGLVCQICNAAVEQDDVHIDHRCPVLRGGPTTLDNLRVTHSRCNLSKGARIQ